MNENALIVQLAELVRDHARNFHDLTLIVKQQEEQIESMKLRIQALEATVNTQTKWGVKQ